MRSKKTYTLGVVFLFFSSFFLFETTSWAQTSQNDGYHSPSEIAEYLQDLHSSNQNRTTIHTLTETPGGYDLIALEIGPETGQQQKTKPGILVVGNLEGTYPIASEAALDLASRIIEENAAEDKTWYIIPSGNPDAAARYFSSPLKQNSRNQKSHNDDMDENTDEDGWDDLNNDGMITQMRVKDPTGDWIERKGNTLLMKKADRSKGEQGMYAMYSEGLDNDNDGSFNEDGTGGVNVNRNFPHLFKDFTETGGAWPGSTPEVYEIMEFAFDHPELAMTFSFGATNFALQPPKGGRQGSADYNNIEIPKDIAEQIGADPNRTYSMQEVLELVQPLAPPGYEISESDVASFLGLGAVVNPREADLKFYNELADQYKKFLEDRDFNTDRLAPKAAVDGSFELWSYYHLGLPTFSMNLWTLPKAEEKEEEKGSGLTAEKIGEMSSDEFVALGEEKIGMFLKEIGAPDRFQASMVIKMVESGQMTPQRMASMVEQMPQPTEAGEIPTDEKALLAYNDKVLDGKGYVEWQSYEHPTLGTVEIGGEAPYVRTTPPFAKVDSLLDAQVPWVLNLADKIAKLGILKVEADAQGSGVYKVNVWVQNERYLPFPTAMGEKNKQPAPAALTLQADDLMFISGKKRTAIQSIGGYETKKLSWIVRSPNDETIDISLESANAWNDQTTLKLGDSQ